LTQPGKKGFPIGSSGQPSGGYAKRLRGKKPPRKDVWHLDEVVVTIGGRKHWLWRAADQDGYVLDEIVQARRDTTAAKRLLIRLLKKQGLVPRRLSPINCVHTGRQSEI